MNLKEQRKPKGQANERRSRKGREAKGLADDECKKEAEDRVREKQVEGNKEAEGPVGQEEAEGRKILLIGLIFKKAQTCDKFVDGRSTKRNFEEQFCERK